MNEKTINVQVVAHEAVVPDTGLPFAVTRENPNQETTAALNEYYEIKAHPEKYKRYSSFEKAMDEVFSDI